MPRIVDNRICYADHNVVLREDLHKLDTDRVFDKASVLTIDGRAGAHRNEIERFELVGSGKIWSIELPIVTIEPMYNSEDQERHPACYLPGRMLCKITLHNGNYQKVIFVATCCKEQGFKHLWDKAYRCRIKIGKAQRRVAEAQYNAAYKVALKAYNPPTANITP